MTLERIPELSTTGADYVSVGALTPFGAGRRHQLRDRTALTGSCMSFQPDTLPADFADALSRVEDQLGRLGSPVLFFSTIGSTNDVASALAVSGDREGAVVIAEAQTAGRGRRGRTWFSPPGAGPLHFCRAVAGSRAPRARSGNGPAHTGGWRRIG